MKNVEYKKFIVIGLWLATILVALYVYFFHGEVLQKKFLSLSGSSLFIAYALYLVASSLRGFTLIPVTYFIVVGIILLPPVPLYVLTLIGVLFSSASIYYFSEYLNLDHYFESNHGSHIKKIKGFLSTYEMPVVVMWSFLPFLPTDLICYVCGTLEVNIKKFLLGVVIGEGISCAVYIFLGKEIMSKILSM